MKEKWSAWAAQFQKNAIALSDLAADAAYGIGKRAEAELDALKLRRKVQKQKETLDAQLRELGELLYATHTGHPTDSDVLLSKMQEIDRLHAELDAMMAQIGEAPGLVCPVCGAAVEACERFCRSCGQALKEEL